jgi:hypothetical protein
MESAKEQCKRMLAKHSKTIPRILGNPLLEGIGNPDSRLADESPGHIAAYTLGYLQELAARVQQCCEDQSETPERKREACQLLVNIASETATDIHLLVRKFPEAFRAIAENRSNFPCLFPAHPGDIRELKNLMLDGLELGKLHSLKLRSLRKTFSKQKYVNSLLLHYIAKIYRMRRALLDWRFSDPLASAATPLSKIERLVDQIPLSVPNARPWIDMIWQLLLLDIPRPETEKGLRSLGSRPSRRGRATTTDFAGFVKRRKRKKAFAGEASYIRFADAFSRRLQFIGLDSFNRSTRPALDFGTFLKIDNFNFHHLAATLTLG